MHLLILFIFVSIAALIFRYTGRPALANLIIIIGVAGAIADVGANSLAGC